MNRLPDWIVDKLVTENPNLLVPWYLILSYAYYIMNETIVSDYLYDQICLRLKDAIETFSIDHRHMHLCDISRLEEGTAFHLTEEEYPRIAESSAKSMIAGTSRLQQDLAVDEVSQSLE